MTGLANTAENKVPSSLIYCSYEVAAMTEGFLLAELHAKAGNHQLTWCKLVMIVGRPDHSSNLLSIYDRHMNITDNDIES